MQKIIVWSVDVLCGLSINYLSIFSELVSCIIIFLVDLELVLI